MARKYSDGRPFCYKINIYSRETYQEQYDANKKAKMRMVRESDQYRKKIHELIKMYFVFQILRMKQQIRRPWYCYYSVSRFGAPGEREFLCPITTMIAKRIRPQDAVKYREYYAKCISKSQEILRWLVDLPSTEYNFGLHQYLLRFVITPRPWQHIASRYDKEKQLYQIRALR